MGFDLDCNADTQIELTKQLYDQFAEGSETHPNFYYEIKGLETQRTVSIPCSADCCFWESC